VSAAGSCRIGRCQTCSFPGSNVSDTLTPCYSDPMMTINAYVFRDTYPASGGAPVVCVVERAAADERLGPGQVESLFGGCAIYTTPEGQDFIGVWGARNASRLRRFLSERGAEVSIHRERPFNLRLRYATTRRGSRPRIRVLQ